MTKLAATRTLVSNLTFPEAPRWRDGRLWFSDFYSRAIYAVDPGGRLEKIVDAPGQPSGLGWLPNGDLLFVSMIDQKVMRYAGGRVRLHADLSPFARFHCNDMIVLSSGRAYVGNFGFDPWSEKRRPTTLIKIEPDGAAMVAADGIEFPNGMATLDGETTLVVAESVGERLLAFDIRENGALTNRRVFAKTPGCQPDGICADENGEILVATMVCNKLVRLSPSGVAIATQQFEKPVWACAVGGPRGNTVFLCTSEHAGPSACEEHRSGAIEIVA